MGRPPVFRPVTKTKIVSRVLSGEASVAEAARKENVSEQSIGRWKAEFLEAGKTALAAGRSGRRPASFCGLFDVPERS